MIAGAAQSNSCLGNLYRRGVAAVSDLYAICAAAEPRRRRSLITFANPTAFAAHVAASRRARFPLRTLFLPTAPSSGWRKPSQGTPSRDEILALLLSFFHMSGM